MKFLEKSQWVRLIDIFIIGPYLIWYAINYNYSKKHKEKVPSLLQTFVIAIGCYTIIYNAYNFLGHYVSIYPLP